MGNCFVCIKEPEQHHRNTQQHQQHSVEEVAQAQQEVAKEDMPEDIATAQTTLINGNHLVTETRIHHQHYQRKKPSVMGISESKPSDSKLNALFDLYKDEDDCILEEGIEKLCNDLQLSPDEFKVLLLAWKLDAKQMCCFTREEFTCGLRNLRVDSLKSLQNRLPELVTEVKNNDESFKNLYRFTFKFGLDSASGQRILPVDMAIILWKLVFTVREPPILERWLNFLKKHEQYRGIPKDTWNMFLNFSDTVGNDLSSYDDNEAWPSLFDDFVEYENDQANQNISKDTLFITQDD